jgi:hypothetical protein
MRYLNDSTAHLAKAHVIAAIGRSVVGRDRALVDASAVTAVGIGIAWEHGMGRRYSWMTDEATTRSLANTAVGHNTISLKAAPSHWG